jgi:hypothetical protein
MSELHGILRSLDRRALLYSDVRLMPRNEEELYNWVKGYFGWQMARRNVCPDHQAPLSVLADLVFERVLDVIILANRTGGKTLLMALANLADSLFKPGCEIASVGAIIAQARKCYSYYRDMVEGPLLYDEVTYLSEQLTKLKNGSEVRVLPGTMTGTNAPHPHKARADEVELIDWEVLQQFFSMARSSNRILGQNCLTSTRKTLTGSMQKLMDKVRHDPSFPFEVRQWCIFEALAPNPQGGPNCPCKRVMRAGDEKSFYDSCQGKCREADGFYVVQDAWRKFSTLEPEVWDAEWECLKPARRGVVYKDMPDDRFLRLQLDPNRDTWACCDWGFTHPFAFLVCQSDTQDNVYVLRELYVTNLEPSSMVMKVAELFEEMGLDRTRVTTYPDPRGAAEIAEFRKAGFRMHARAVEVQAGVNWVKKWVRGVGHPKLFVDGEMCPNLRWEMLEGYQYRPDSEMPKDENNHACDALRYGICGRFPMRASLDFGSGGEVPVSAGDSHKSSLPAGVRGQGVRR